jgi:hypothetical protein
MIDACSELIMPPWWDWNAVGAIGQWLGAIATFAAVVVALRADRRARTTYIVVGITLGALGEKMKGGPAFAISVVNHSGRTVILDGAGILLPDGRQLGPIVSEVFIGEIKDLERRQHAFPVEKVASWLIEAKIVVPTKLHFFVRDTTGKLHRCQYKFDPSPWLTK